MIQLLLILDTETGGLDPYKDSLLSVGGIVWDAGRVVAEIDILVAEDTINVEADAMKINRIDLEHIRLNGLQPREAVLELERFLDVHFGVNSKVALAGHNVGFDAGFLKRLYRLGGESYQKRFSHRLLDTASVMRFLALANRLPFEDPSLDAGLRHFGIQVPNKDRHSALGDARATAQLLNKLIRVVQT